jgi:hypothetical protein
MARTTSAKSSLHLSSTGKGCPSALSPLTRRPCRNHRSGCAANASALQTRIDEFLDFGRSALPLPPDFLDHPRHFAITHQVEFDHCSEAHGRACLHRGIRATRRSIPSQGGARKRTLRPRASGKDDRRSSLARPAPAQHLQTASPGRQTPGFPRSAAPRPRRLGFPPGRATSL